jgi:hypothetical protein
LAHVSKYNDINDVESHASALARGNVVWAVLPSYGKGKTLAPARTKTIQPIKTKFGKRDYVPGIT